MGDLIELADMGYNMLAEEEKIFFGAITGIFTPYACRKLNISSKKEDLFKRLVEIKCDLGNKDPEHRRALFIFNFDSRLDLESDNPVYHQNRVYAVEMQLMEEAWCANFRLLDMIAPGGLAVERYGHKWPIDNKSDTFYEYIMKRITVFSQVKYNTKEHKF